MVERNKVSSTQLFLLWKNLSFSLAVLISVVVFTRLLPYFAAPMVSLVGAAVLYTLMYKIRMRDSGDCILMSYAVFYCLICYTFIAIVINVLYAWGIIMVPGELIFFNQPYLPTLLVMPISFLTVTVMYLRRHKLQICKDCRTKRGTPAERGIFGAILTNESGLQLRNLMILFGLISVVVWGYYLFIYVNISINGRDNFVFGWIDIIGFFLDEAYFAIRYYNLYLDLQERNEIISPDELSDMTAKTYVRFYVVCGNRLYIDSHSTDPTVPFKEVTDTPFETRRTVNGISELQIKNMAERMTGRDGELRFFFGRKLHGNENHSILRYFYFVEPDENGEPPKLNSVGEWKDFDYLKRMYSNQPGEMSRLFISDLSRLATIILTEKTFDEKGNRKSRIKSYTPTFSLKDVRSSNLDFQDEKWIKISNFNSDTPFFRLKKMWRDFTGATHNYN